VVLAIPASGAGRLLATADAPLSAELAAIPYASTAVVSLAYRRRQIAHPLDGFGFVVPALEGRRILSASFSSQKFPGRAPADHVLLRIFIGGACQAEYLERGDAELQQLATEEIADLLGARGEPLFAAIARWPESMPQYHLGHLDRVCRIESRLASMPSLALAGNAYRGVGIPQVVESGEAAAQRVLEALQARRQPSLPPNA
jgi:oxygen-dependent protoporphyrinogen oxidase